MKKLCLIFVVSLVSSLGQRNSNVNKDEKGIVKDVDNGENYESVLMERDDNTKQDVKDDKKYIDLFENRFEAYGDGESYQVDDGNPDIHGIIERPCQVYDTFCIRKFFADHSRCKISGRRVPDSVFRTQLTVNYPRTNMSATQVNVEYQGLNNARIEEFYINRATDNLVISIFFESVNTTAKDTYLKFYLRGREPIITRDFGTVDAIQYSVTAVIPNLKDLRLDRAEVTSYLNTPLLPFAVGPGLAASTDPEVQAMLAIFLSNPGLDQIEGVATEASFYAGTYIQYAICDFGLKVL